MKEENYAGRIRDGDLDYVKRIVRADPGSVNSIYKNYGSLLSLAVWGAQFEIAAFLLEHGADPNLSYNGDPESVPLGLSAHIGDIDIAELLLQHGAKIDAGLVSGEELEGTPYMIAARYGNVEMCHFLIAQGADGAFVLSNGANALSYALGNAVDFSIEEDLSLIRFTVENGANPNCVINEQYPRYETTPLLRAGQARRRDIYDYLVSVGANPNYKDYFGNTPADYLEGRATPEH